MKTVQSSIPIMAANRRVSLNPKPSSGGMCRDRSRAVADHEDYLLPKATLVYFEVRAAALPTPLPDQRPCNY